VVVLVVPFGVCIAPDLGGGSILRQRPTSTLPFLFVPVLVLALVLALVLFIGSIKLAENKRHDLVDRHVE
jgi:hypothetical protein